MRYSERMAGPARPAEHHCIKKSASVSERRTDTVSIIHLRGFSRYPTWHCPGTGVRALHAPLGASARTGEGDH